MSNNLQEEEQQYYNESDYPKGYFTNWNIFINSAKQRFHDKKLKLYNEGKISKSQFEKDIKNYLTFIEEYETDPPEYFDYDSIDFDKFEEDDYSIYGQGFYPGHRYNKSTMPHESMNDLMIKNNMRKLEHMGHSRQYRDLSDLNRLRGEAFSDYLPSIDTVKSYFPSEITDIATGVASAYATGNPSHIIKPVAKGIYKAVVGDEDDIKPKSKGKDGLDGKKYVFDYDKKRDYDNEDAQEYIKNLIKYKKDVDLGDHQINDRLKHEIIKKKNINVKSKALVKAQARARAKKLKEISKENGRSKALIQAQARARAKKLAEISGETGRSKALIQAQARARAKKLAEIARNQRY